MDFPLRKARTDAGLTQEDVARAVGVSAAYISYIERNKHTPSGGDVVERIHKVLGIEVANETSTPKVDPSEAFWQEPQPIPMILTCPCCGKRHLDEGEYATKTHHTHACQHCGMCWRPAVVPTVGVQFLPGFKNEE